MSTITEAREQYDLGLREFMLNMYNPTAAGLAVSGIVAWLVYKTGMLLQWLGHIGYLLCSFRDDTMVSFAGRNWSYDKLRTTMQFCDCDGSRTCTYICCIHSLQYNTIFYSACTFAGASIWGYTTKA